jgi:hypothetical protein
MYMRMNASYEKPHNIQSTSIASIHTSHPILVSSDQTSTAPCRAPHLNRRSRVSCLRYSAYTSVASGPATWPRVTPSMHAPLITVWRRWCGCRPVEGIC